VVQPLSVTVRVLVIAAGLLGIGAAFALSRRTKLREEKIAEGRLRGPG
jgi:hypothetical protein